MKAIFWIILAVLFVTFEILTPGTFYFFCLAIGFIVAALSTLFVNNLITQFIIFIFFSLSSIILLKPIIKRINNKETRDSNVDGLIGKQGIVIKSIIPEKGEGLVKVEGEEWRAVADKKINKDSLIKVKQVISNRLFVEEI